jgi:hypothetical protein
MIFHFILFITLLNGPNPAHNRHIDNINISGTVVEDMTGEPVAGAIVHINELDKDYYTDFEGNFKIDNLIPGNYSITVSFVSFKSVSLNNINKTSTQVLFSLR